MSALLGPTTCSKAAPACFGLCLLKTPFFTFTFSLGMPPPVPWVSSCCNKQLLTDFCFSIQFMFESGLKSVGWMKSYKLMGLLSSLHFLPWLLLLLFSLSLSLSQKFAVSMLGCFLCCGKNIMIKSKLWRRKFIWLNTSTSQSIPERHQGRNPGRNEQRPWRNMAY